METLTVKTDAEKLNDWLTNLSVKEYPTIVGRILTDCMISRDKLNNWRYGKARIEPIYKTIIENIAESKIFDDEVRN